MRYQQISQVHRRTAAKPKRALNMFMQISEDEAVTRMRAMDTVLLGHYVGTKGGHMDAYVNKDVLSHHPTQLRPLVGGIAYLVTPPNNRPDVDLIVAAPMGALAGGVMLAEELGVDYVFLEEFGDMLEVKRAPFLSSMQGARVGLFEDIVNSGGTTHKTIEAVESAGGTVVWVSCLWSRGGETAESLGVPSFHPLVNKRLSLWTPEECAVSGPCSHHVPINTGAGHGWRFQDENPDYEGGFID